MSGHFHIPSYLHYEKSSACQSIFTPFPLLRGPVWEGVHLPFQWPFHLQVIILENFLSQIIFVNKFKWPVYLKTEIGKSTLYLLMFFSWLGMVIFVSMTWKFHELKLQASFVILTYFSTDIYNRGPKSNRTKHMITRRPKTTQNYHWEILITVLARYTVMLLISSLVFI